MKAMLTILAILIASSAIAGTIVDVQTGLVPVNTQVMVTNAVVTGVRYNGFFMSEDPNAPYAGIWVYTGSTPVAVTGDLVDVTGFYVEYYDLSEIDVDADPDGLVTVTGIHLGALYPLDVTTSDLAADGEPYESCFIRVTDGMTVVAAPDTYGEWTVASYENPSVELIMDDYWYDETTVALGDCYNCATGILYYGYGAFKLEPMAEAICITDCTVDSETVNFDQVKSLYR
jgi:5'-nucleotidase / UDP-sugar diphosphatase